jgi:hypothetical protein
MDTDLIAARYLRTALDAADHDGSTTYAAARYAGTHGTTIDVLWGQLCELRPGRTHHYSAVWATVVDAWHATHTSTIEPHEVELFLWSAPRDLRSSRWSHARPVSQWLETL